MFFVRLSVGLRFVSVLLMFMISWLLDLLSLLIWFCVVLRVVLIFFVSFEIVGVVRFNWVLVSV